jgi:TRAP-type C4-dicarboxylate transport system substrate-binding protein
MTTMRTRSTIPIALGGAALLSVAALGPVLAQKGPGDPEPPVALRLFVQDGPGRQSEPAALDLARLAEEISGGSISIEPVFDSGDVTAAVISGEAELGMVPSRDWGAAGVSSLDVLEAPFLIDDDELALAVATSDIADRAMAGLDAVGVTGLAMWPEDLRHLFAMNPSGADFSTPAGLGDADVLVVAGIPGHELITTLGGRIYAEYETAGDLTGDRVTDATAGTLEGMVTGLWGAGLPTVDVTVAGDLVVHSKYQMLVANAAALGRLSEQQRVYLDEIVAATHAAALGRHYPEAELAAQLCERGGRVVSLGAEAVDAFKATAQPLTDALATDPVTGELMAAVEALRAETPVAPDAGVCEPDQAPLYPISDTSDTYGTLPPDGSYRAEVTYDDLVAKGADPSWSTANAGTMTWTFAGDTVTQLVDGRAPCSGTALSRGGAFVSLVTDGGDQPCDLDLSFVWRPTPDGVAFVLVAPESPWTVDDFTTVQAHLEREWVRIDGPMPSITPLDAASELPVPGVWRISHTVESLVESGVSPSMAESWAGSVTMTLDGSRWDFTHSTKDGDFPCGGAYALDGDDLVLTFDINPQSCGTAPVRLRWLASGVDTAAVRESGMGIFGGEWTRIADAPATPDASAFIGDQPVPAGSYRIAVSLDELVAAGATRDFAGRNEGAWTWTFTDDGWSAVHDVRNEQCSGGMTVAGDHVELSDTPTGRCGLGYDLRWRLEGDGIRFEVLDVNWTQATPEILADERALIEQLWARVE